MSKILIAHNFEENSFAIMSFSLAHYLADKGHEVIFISHKPFYKETFQIEKSNGGKIIIMSWKTVKRPNTFSDFIHFIKIYLKYKPKIVIGHFVGANITSIISKLFFYNKTKVFVYYHTVYGAIIKDSNKNRIKEYFLKKRKKILYKYFTNCIICPSSFAERDLKKIYSINKTKVILNPINDRFQNKILNESIISILYLGRIDPTKGVIEMIDAFLEYSELYKNSRIRIKIAGFGSLENDLKLKIEKNDKINFIGKLQYQEIDKQISDSHYTIIPSLFDAFNMVAIESLMNATPVLISNTTGVSEYLEDGKEALKFNIENEEIKNIFLRIENISDKEYQFMSTKARLKYIEKFSIEEYCAKMDNLIFC